MADRGSLDFLKCGTRQFLRRLSGSGQRCRSADVSREEVRRRLFAERLSQLRQDMEKKTERLNDSSFEVTEAWLFEFAGQHAEYMEQATSRAGTSHEFRSTTDLFQHVLQHPNVLKTIGSWQSSLPAPPLVAKPSPSRSDAQVAWSPVSTDTPGSADRLAEESDGVTDGIAEAASGVDEAKPATCAKDSSAVTVVADCLDAAQEIKEPVKPVRPPPAPLAKLPWPPAKPIAPRAFPPVIDAGKSKATRSSSSGAVCKSSPADGRRGSWPIPGAAPASGESELMRKLQQRSKGAAWGGLSPRSQRLAEAQGKSKGGNDTGEEQAVSKIAARRKLLESKLADCGFQKAAATGGA